MTRDKNARAITCAWPSIANRGDSTYNDGREKVASEFRSVRDDFAVAAMRAPCDVQTVSKIKRKLARGYNDGTRREEQALIARNYKAFPSLTYTYDRGRIVESSSRQALAGLDTGHA